MAWLQSSFTSHQLLGDSGNNHKKGFKGSSAAKNSDPDKSDTPLLHDSLQNADSENRTSGWMKNSCNFAEKKQNLLGGSSKTNFMPTSLFEKTLGSKNKMQTFQNSSNTTYDKKPAENMKLLSDDNKKNPLFDEDDDDSDDDWCIPRLGGYQKVRPCVE